MDAALQRVTTGSLTPAGDARGRLLGLLGRSRWAVIALAVAYAVAGGPTSGERTALLGLSAFAATYNLLISISVRGRRWLPVPLATVSVAGDFIWVTAAAALLGTSSGESVATLGYVAVGAECGFLLSRRATAGWVTAGIVAFTLLEVVQERALAASVDPVTLFFGVSSLLAATAFAALAASELRAQRDDLLVQQASLARRARTDHLTGLANKEAFDDALASASGSHGLLLIDVDDTRWVNQVYGYAAGDELLHAVAGILRGVGGAEAVSARLAEDKFLVLLPSGTHDHVATVAAAVRAEVQRVAVAAGRLRVSIGCAWSDGSTDPRALMTHADDALLAAKAAGGDRVEMVGPSRCQGRWTLRRTVESILADAGGVYSVYQPIVDLAGRRTVGWEALARPLRWPADTSVEGLFITAHRMGRARDLDWRCRQAALHEGSHFDGPLFLNVSSATILDPLQHVDQMLVMCERAGRDPRTVVLELSERDGLPDLRQLRRVLRDYRTEGFRFALDDLGEGQTSFELILAARPEFFKVAKSVVQGAADDAAAHAAVGALVSFAHGIGSAVIAEGIETDAMRELCLELDVDQGQGWLFGAPARARR